MKNISVIHLFLFVLFFAGCQTTGAKSSKVQYDDEMKSAVEAVAGAVSGQNLSEEDYEELEQQLRTDPEARSAVETIGNTLSGQDAVIKYSPVTGKRYAGHMEYDPETGVKLEVLEP